MSEPWEALWDRAMVAIDSLRPAFPSGVDWSFGGGTAMQFVFNHRESKDVEIFVTDASVIGGLSPRLNGTTERLTATYTEQSNFLTLRFPEGEIDFILATRLVRDVPFERMTVRGREVNVERPIEIVAKKCFYRPADFTARDIFDLAVLIDQATSEVEEHRDLLLAKRDDLTRRLNTLRVAQARAVAQQQIDALAITPAFTRITPRAIDMVLEFVNGGPP